MAVSFPTDKTQPFQADNGVIYAWDENRWRVKAFRSVDDFLVIIDDNPPDPAKIGDLWYDSKPDELTLYLYTGAEWVPAAPPVSLDGINATIEAALIVQNDLLEQQAVQNSQINALETQVQLLAQVKAIGRWTYRRRVDSGPRPPATRTFYGTDVRDITAPLTSWEHTNLLMISKTDLDDNNFTFSDFEEGDKVEVIAKDGSSAVYGTVTNNPNVDAYGNMVIDVERWRGGPVEEAEYLISAYRPGSSNGNVDLDILDGRYLVKTGDEMTGELNIDKSSGTALTISKDGQDNLKLWADGTVETTKTTFADNNFVTKEYVDTAPTPKIYPGLRFGFGNGTVAVGVFNFNYYLDGSQLKLRISNSSKDYKWNDGGLTEDYRLSEGHRFTIYQLQDNGSLKIVRTGTYNRLDYHTNDVLVYVSSHKTNGSITVGPDYYLTLSGIF